MEREGRGLEQAGRFAQEARFQTGNDALVPPVILIAQIGLGHGTDQTIVADQIVRQADSLCAHAFDEAAGKRIEIAEQAMPGDHLLAIGLGPAAIARHAGGGIGIGICGKRGCECLHRSGKHLGIAIDEDEALARQARRIEHEAVPAARLAAFRIIVDGHAREAARDVRCPVMRAVHDGMNRNPGIAQRQAAETARNPALLIMRQYRDDDRRAFHAVPLASNDEYWLAAPIRAARRSVIELCLQRGRNESRDLGVQAMRWFTAASAALVAAMTTTLSAQDVQSGDAAPLEKPPGNPPGDLEVFKTSAEANNRLTVPVTVEGQGPYRFMIDTGAQATILSRELADRLGVADRKSATLVGISSRAPIEVAPVMELGLGKRLFYIETVPLVAQDNIGSADGILGLDSLQEQRVMLDFRANTFSVADAATLGGDKGYDIIVRARRVLGQLVITDAELDGVKVAVIVGTGAQGSVGNLALQERLRGRELGEAHMTDINGAMETSNVRLAKSVTIGRVKVSNLPVAFVDSPTFEALGLDDRPAMVLGMSELKLFKRVAIDFKQRKVLFDLPPGTGWFNSPAGGMGSN
ncbi:MAG: hypothetical protein B7Y88_14600 [Sphingomonadales bacterium 32-64-17]|nr:MAG: hypothetical protein B7Y88_14600 [Sphingomonadales bacterium 32-64-17]